MTLDGILGRFEKVKTDLTSFIKQTDNDIAAIGRENNQLQEQIRTNHGAINHQRSEKKRAKKALKQITKMTGGKA